MLRTNTAYALAAAERSRSPLKVKACRLWAALACRSDASPILVLHSAGGLCRVDGQVPMNGAVSLRRWIGRSVGRTRLTRAESLAHLVLVFAVLGAVVMPASAVAATRLVLTTQPDVPFPVRVYAFSLPGDEVPTKVRVTENGHLVQASVTPIGVKRIPFSAAVLLDSSLTMLGKPLVAARTAATTLIERKPARSELALYGFYAVPYILSDWSASKRRLTSSLDLLHTAYGTAVWDSVILASQRLGSREGSAKAIVILTDGRADTTKTNVRSAIRAATHVGARVFVVIAGRGGAGQRARLGRLADATGGAVLKVSSIEELRAAFAELARTLSRQYLLSYASKVGPGKHVRVHVRINNAAAATGYATPGRPVPPPGPSFWFTTQRRGRPRPRDPRDTRHARTSLRPRTPASI